MSSMASLPLPIDPRGIEIRRDWELKYEAQYGSWTIDEAVVLDNRWNVRNLGVVANGPGERKQSSTIAGSYHPGG